MSKCVIVCSVWLLCCGLMGCEATPQKFGQTKKSATAKVLTPQYKKASTWLEAGRTQPAIDLCLLHVEQEPDCHRVLGVGYRQQKNKEKACFHLQTYLKRTDARHVDVITRMVRGLACSA